MITWPLTLAFLTFAGSISWAADPEDKSLQFQTQLQAARDLMQAQGHEPSVRELATRIESVEKAVALAHDDLVRVPTTLDKGLTSLKEFLEEKISGNDRVALGKFDSIGGQFVERDKRADLLVVQQKDAADKLAMASTENIAAALLAQKETADKSEKSLLESLAQQRTLFQADIQSLNGTINDLKSRLDRGEGKIGGSDQTYIYLFGFIGAAGVIISFVFAIISRGRQPRPRDYYE